MAVVLKPGEVKVKDNNGNFININILAEGSTQEYLDAIDAKGQETIDDIETKGQETIASIPDNYTDLSNEVTDLKGALDKEARDIDILKRSLSSPLVIYPYNNSTITITGITWTDNGDGTITANGTSTSVSQNVLRGWTIERNAIPINENKAYFITGGPKNGSLSNYNLSIRAYKNNIIPGPSTGDLYRDYGDGILISGYTYISIYLNIYSNITVNNLIFEPAVREIGSLVDASDSASNMLEALSRFVGKRVSIIGDSIDTYNASGYKIDGYAMYYPRFDVTNVDQTWWMQVINTLGASLEVNASYSGSFVTNYISDRPDFYERVSIIGNPEIIFVTLGTNDSTNSVTLGDYDFTSNYTSLSESTFRTAYIKGIKALQTLYPNAEIVAITEYMKDAYRESIKHICSVLNILYINAPDYTRFEEVHPDLAGMNKIARHILFPMVSTDVSLSQKYYPADAKATGNRIAAIDGPLSGDGNILPYPYSETTKTSGGITYTDNGDGTITVNGTASATSTFVCAGWTIENNAIAINEDEEYILTGCPEGAKANTFFLACRAYPEGVIPSSYSGKLVREYGQSATISGCKYISIYIGVLKNAVMNNVIFNPKLIRKNIVDAITNVKNFSEYYNYNELTGLYVSSGTVSGVTIDVTDNVVSLSGTATADIDLILAYFTPGKSGSYKFSGIYGANVVSDNLKISVYNTITSSEVTSTRYLTAIVELDGNTTYRYSAQIKNGTNCNGIKVYPFITKNTNNIAFRNHIDDKNVLKQFAIDTKNEITDSTAIAYKEKFINIVDQTNGKFPYIIDGNTITVYPSTATLSTENGSIIFGEINLPRGYSKYRIEFDYVLVNTKAAYLTTVNNNSISGSIQSFRSIKIEPNTSGHMSVSASLSQYERHFRLYYNDITGQLSISNLKIIRLNEIVDNAINDSINGSETVQNPVMNSITAADPTVMLEDNIYYSFSTFGNAPRMIVSSDLVNWQSRGSIGNTDLLNTFRSIVNPSGSNTVGVWAPDVIKHNGKYILYCNLVENNNTSSNCHMIALIANKLGGPWMYGGELFNANTFGIKDCIDADVFEMPDGTLYMFFGSTYGNYIVRLNDDGISLDTEQTPILIHPHSPSNDIATKLEGLTVYFRQQIYYTNGNAAVGQYYYLFSSAGNYAKGTGSNYYKLTVARSSNINGPYVDKNGNSLLDGSNIGTVLLEGTKSLLSPGHCSGIIEDKKGRTYVLLHAYEYNVSWRTLCLQEIKWGDDGWPYVENGIIGDFVAKPNV